MSQSIAKSFRLCGGGIVEKKNIEISGQQNNGFLMRGKKSVGRGRKIMQGF